jgi:3-phenylpropionate/trans-cinnamate dioxygenase ferredoxin reductase component
MVEAASSGIVIVGAGHAGGTLAAQLRQYSYGGSITLIGDEPWLPYHRPPLSKAWLKGETTLDSLTLRPMAFYAESTIGLRPAVAVTEIWPKERRVQLSSGESLAYDSLVLATGGSPIRLPIPGAGLSGVHVLRTLHDAEVLRSKVGMGTRVAIIGGGYIGLEVAASVAALGGQALVIEREPRLLARTGGKEVAQFLYRYHSERGVRILLGATVTEILGVSHHVSAVGLSTGEAVDCDIVVMGVGIRPNDDLAARAGLACARGIIVDLDGRTSDPNIFAIGDVARRPVPQYECTMVLESVHNAVEQAKRVACALTARPAPHPEVPWNWSDQFDLKLQFAGLHLNVNRSVVRANSSPDRFAVFHLEDDVVQQVESVNSPAEFMAGRQLIHTRKPVDVARLANAAIPIKDLLRQ